MKKTLLVEDTYCFILINSFIAQLINLFNHGLGTEELKMLVKYAVHYQALYLFVNYKWYQILTIIKKISFQPMASILQFSFQKVRLV